MQTRPAVLFILTLLLSSCVLNIDRTREGRTAGEVHRQFERDTANHLRSISEKDIELMKTTLPETGELYLTLPDGSMTTTVEEFVSGQSEWFDTVDFTFETELIKSEHGPEYGYMLVFADYRVPERDGRPYYHRMFVSYVLRHEDDRWVVIKDHASTLSKTH